MRKGYWSNYLMRTSSIEDMYAGSIIIKAGGNIREVIGEQ